MGNLIKLILILAVAFVCVAVGTSGYLFNENQSLRSAFKPSNVVLDGGVFVQASAVKSVFGDAAVKVHTSPPGSGTMGAKSVASDGTIHVWVPATFAGSAAALTPGEAQEYVLRALAKCSDSECVFDSAGMPLDAAVLSEMAADTNVKRAGETSQMFGTFVQADLAKHALDKQAEVAEHGMDRIADVAISGDTAQAATVAAFAMRDSVIGFAIIAVAILVFFLVMKGIIGRGNNNDRQQQPYGYVDRREQ